MQLNKTGELRCDEFRPSRHAAALQCLALLKDPKDPRLWTEWILMIMLWNMIHVQER
jgi:hypothetical protein